MNTTLPMDLASAYQSPSQKARVVTEAWAAQNLFCPACPADQLRESTANTPAVDFRCARCAQNFQLKGKSSPFGKKIVDGAYEALMTALRGDSFPDLFLLHYDRTSATVRDLFLVPHFGFPPSAVECRRPLSATARRAGWVGCNIVLSRIPTDAQIVAVLHVRLEVVTGVVVAMVA